MQAEMHRLIDGTTLPYPGKMRTNLVAVSYQRAHSSDFTFDDDEINSAGRAMDSLAVNRGLRDKYCEFVKEEPALWGFLGLLAIVAPFMTLPNLSITKMMRVDRNTVYVQSTVQRLSRFPLTAAEARG